MWNEISVIFLLSYTAIGGIWLLTGFVRQFRKEKRNRSVDQVMELSDLTVIIPFRNEAEKLTFMLEDFQKSVSRPHMILFVNDHSEDKGEMVLKNYTIEGFEFSVLDLPENKAGKKEAIRYGLKHVSTRYVLTMDADIRFDPNFFDELTKIQWRELNVLPVKMQSERYWGRLAEMDHLLVNALNVSAAGWKRPFIASGANLLFDINSFRSYDRFEQHKHIPSGDDTYLLRDFRNAGADVRVFSNAELAVRTGLPQTWKAFFSQRVRWAAKTGDVGDAFANTIVLLQGIVTIAFSAMLILLVVRQDVLGALLFWGVKSGIDVVLFLPFFMRVRRLVSISWMPVFELIYPFYALAVLIASLVMKPTWKGRTIRVR